MTAKAFEFVKLESKVKGADVSFKAVLKNGDSSDQIGQMEMKK